MKARRLMIQGTASGVGKSLLVAGLCRLFRRRGWRVAPFKAQNMALNSWVAADGGEMGRAQVVQAEAAGIVPDVRMNPILLKPASDHKSQVIVDGRVHASMTATEYYRYRPRLRPRVLEAFESLAAEYELVVLEGAGSPAEINLAENDVVNMGMAAMADAPVLLVADIDRGGVFASLYGTVRLLLPDEQARIAGCVINKFRGNLDILRPGIAQLERLVEKPVLGVLPYARFHIEEEDSLTDRLRVAGPDACAGSGKGALDVVVVRFPRLSNFTDFAVFETFSGVGLRFVDRVEQLGRPDLLILPGSKTTMDDLLFLKRSGMALAVQRLARQGTVVAGVCGGFQMLGHAIRDRSGAESSCSAMAGLGLLDVETEFFPGKQTRQTRARLASQLPGVLAGVRDQWVEGYEIHMGRTVAGSAVLPMYFGAQGELLGAVNAPGTIFGTYLHGIFDNLPFTRALLETLARRTTRQGRACAVDGPSGASYAAVKDAEYDRLADMLEEHLHMPAVEALLRDQR